MLATKSEKLDRDGLGCTPSLWHTGNDDHLLLILGTSTFRSREDVKGSSLLILY